MERASRWGRWRTCALAADVAALALAAAGVVLRLLNQDVSAPGVQEFRAQQLVAATAFGLGALVLVLRRTAFPLAVAASVVAFWQAAAYAAAQYGIFVLVARPGSGPFGPTAVWLSVWVGQIGYWSVTFVLLLLPDGRLRSPRWRPAAVCGALAVLVSALGWALMPYDHLDVPIDFAGLHNPVSVRPSIGLSLMLSGAGLGAMVALAAIIGLAASFRASSALERQQLKWVLIAVCATVGLMIAAIAAGERGDLVLAAAWAPLPIGTALAALRYRLWDVDTVINRAAVYAVLTAGIIVVYVAIVALLGGLLGRELGAPLVATVLVALVVMPVRRRLQSWCDSRLYGDRGDPYAIVARLGPMLEGAAEQGPQLFGSVVTALAAALRLPYVAFLVNGTTVASVGEAGRRVERLPLGPGDGLRSELVVSPRVGESAISAKDLRLLGHLGHQIVAAAHTVQLAEDVQRSRERLVTAREEERRRIRRDLHDELGPQLAGAALQLEQVRRLVGKESAAGRRIGDQADLLRRLVVDVRRLVHDLRPPALDELGLLGAVSNAAALLSSDAFTAEVEVDGEIGQLPAAVEVAAYRIVSEAIANAARHASARHCRVRACCDHRLRLEIVDDGCGLPAVATTGIGLRSMRERAEELGGTLAIDARPGHGTAIRVEIPIGLS